VEDGDDGEWETYHVVQVSGEGREREKEYRGKGKERISLFIFLCAFGFVR
jgi:hypothetical protein